MGNDQCDESATYYGRAYVKNNDTSITLLYDVNGFIAGIQAGVRVPPPTCLSSYPGASVQPPFRLDGITNTTYIITAYFTDPSKICTVGRTQAEFDAQGTGDSLWLPTGMFPENVTRVPMQQSQVGSPWMRGKCFPVMGVHYWYNLTKEMDCNDIVPVFLLYNGGELNAMGWAFPMDLASPNYEHPIPPTFKSRIGGLGWKTVRDIEIVGAVTKVRKKISGFKKERQIERGFKGWPKEIIEVFRQKYNEVGSHSAERGLHHWVFLTALRAACTWPPTDCFLTARKS
ncbi:hypothetical protein ElyMa_004010300 [Elysia marginata]|uniref:Uncharacterized protein n=1 Tax=Elysia marginata TaxID=1093978 RepID=A0AAV4G159_9GAST|nr:hypothetical protein ElyMa_004010300 [Elysia marginata]